MTRAGRRKQPSGRRLTDLVALGLLMKVFPADVVDAVVAECGRTERRRRSLPARSMAYFVMGMALHREDPYEDVLRLIDDGFAWAYQEEDMNSAASKAAIFYARQRLGAEPLAELFTRVAQPLATQEMQAAWLAGRRLVAIDGACLDVPDTPANAAHFGRLDVPAGQDETAPRARVVALAECGTGAMFEAAVGPCTTSGDVLGTPLLAALTPGMLCLAGQGFSGYATWRRAVDAGADLLWRAPTGVRLETAQRLPDGSWIAYIHDSTDDPYLRWPTPVRVIEYITRDGSKDAAHYQLITTVTDHTQAVATELAAAFAQRWRITTAFEELTLRERHPRATLRSRSPDLVEQEIWGILCSHYAIRALMAGVAHPRSVSN